MEKRKLIECLCFMKDTAHTGIFATNEKLADENNLFSDLNLQFGIDEGKIYIDGIVKENTEYVYAYDDRLRHPKEGQVGANAVVEVTTKNGVIKHRVFLYEMN